MHVWTTAWLLLSWTIFVLLPFSLLWPNARPTQLKKARVHFDSQIVGESTTAGESRWEEHGTTDRTVATVRRSAGTQLSFSFKFSPEILHLWNGAAHSQSDSSFLSSTPTKTLSKILPGLLPRRFYIPSSWQWSLTISVLLGYKLQEAVVLSWVPLIHNS